MRMRHVVVVVVVVVVVGLTHVVAIVAIVVVVVVGPTHVFSTTDLGSTNYFLVTCAFSKEMPTH